jgi:hypothetical protein
MDKKIKIHEKFLYEIWKEQKFKKELTTKDGEKISIIDAGEENKEIGGPDFKHARIKIGNITYLGDVEIDSFYSDWKAHGHYLNKKYNKIILHAVLNNDSHQSYVFTQEGRKVQSINLGDFLIDDLKANLQKAIFRERKNRINKMPCKESNIIVEPKEKLEFLFELGMKRFKKKYSVMLERLKEITYLKELNLKEPVVKYDLDEKFYNRKFSDKDFSDQQIWQQLFYESIFEALGYSKNKKEFLKLSQIADLKFLRGLCDKKDLLLYIESSLLHISNLIPDTNSYPDEETTAYIKTVTEIWNDIKPLYDGKTLNKTGWNFSKLRPQNFPTIRIAGGSRILFRIIRDNLLAQIISNFKKIDDRKKLIQQLKTHFIVQGEGYWRKHFIFGQKAKSEIKYFIGSSRADEIMVNVVLPISALYFEIFNKQELVKKVLEHYTHYYHNSENYLVLDVSKTLLLKDAWKRSVLHQGMIELFRNYCSKEKCLECTIGKKVFN